MSAKILYFPNNETTFHPSPDDRPLTIQQFEYIDDKIKSAAYRLDDDFHQLATKNIRNKLRVVFCVRRIEDIPRHQLAEALNVVEQSEKEIIAFRCFVDNLKASFAKNVLRGCDPWTPSLQKKLVRQQARTLPDRPDWTALAKEVESMPFWKP